MSAASALTDHVVALLKADGAVAALARGRVFAEAPGGAAFPYLAAGVTRARDWSVGEARGVETVLVVSAFARRGRNEAEALSAAAVAALDGASAALGAMRLTGLFFQDGETALERDRRTWRTTARFRALIEI